MVSAGVIIENCFFSKVSVLEASKTAYMEMIHGKKETTSGGKKERMFHRPGVHMEEYLKFGDCSAKCFGVLLGDDNGDFQSVAALSQVDCSVDHTAKAIDDWSATIFIQVCQK